MAADETIRIDVVSQSDGYTREIAKATKGTLALELAQIGLETATRALGAAYDQLITKQVEAGREIERLAGASRLAEETIAGIRLKAQGAGLQLDNLVPVDLADRLADLRDGTQSVVDDFGLLGLEAKDFQKLSLDQSLGLIAERMATVSSDTNAAAAATRLFGTVGENWIATFKGGNAELQHFIESAKMVGFGAKENQEAFEQWAKVTGDLTIAIEASSASMTAAFSESGASDVAEKSILSLVAIVASATQAVTELGVTFKMLANGDLTAFDPRRLDDIFTRIFGEGVKKAHEFWKATRGPGDADEVLLPVRKEVKATSNALRGAARDAFDLRAAFQEIADVVMETYDAQLTAEQRAGEAYDARLAHLDEVIRRAREAGAATEDLADLEERAAAASAAARVRYEQEVSAAKAAAAQAERDRLSALDEEIRRYIQQQRAMHAAAAVTIAGAAESVTSSLLQVMQSAGPKARGAALAFFRLNQAAAAASAGVNTALAVTQGLAAAPPPLSFVLAAAQGAAGAAQVAAILAQQPSFHIGSRAGDLAPDETSTTLTRRELVVTPQGQEVADLNAGRHRAEPMLALIAIDHQVVGEATARDLARPNSALRRQMARGLRGHSIRSRR